MRVELNRCQVVYVKTFRIRSYCWQPGYCVDGASDHHDEGVIELHLRHAMVRLLQQRDSGMGGRWFGDSSGLPCYTGRGSKRWFGTTSFLSIIPPLRFRGLHDWLRWRLHSSRAGENMPLRTRAAVGVAWSILF